MGPTAAALEIATRLADQERRLQAVERGPQLANSSVRVDGQDVLVVPALVAGSTAGITAQEALRRAAASEAALLGTQAVADAAYQVAVTAGESATVSYERASTALDAVGAASDAAATAQQTASAAQSAASAAQDAADAAQAAADAAGSGDGAGSAAAAAAQDAADAAQATADAARAAADAATSAAGTAQQTADRKATVTVSPNPPSGSGQPGDLWFRRVATTGTIIGQWSWLADKWASQLVGSTVIANLDAGKITTGTLGVGTEIRIGGTTGQRALISSAGIFLLDAAGSVAVALPTSGTAIFRGRIQGSEVLSSNYVEDTSGFRLDGETGTVEAVNVRVLDSLNATTVKATDVLLNGQSLAAYVAKPQQGPIVQGTVLNTSIQGRTTETGIADISFTAMPGRAYRFEVSGPEYGTSDINTGIEFNVREARGGAAPTVTSPLRHYLGGEFGGSAPGRMYRAFRTWYSDVTEPTKIRWLFTFKRAGGSGTVGINSTGSRAMQIFVEDAGGQLVNSAVENVSSTVNPPPPPPPARQTYGPEPFFFNGAMAYYGGNGGQRTQNGPELWQGYGPSGAGSNNGNQHGMLFFNLASIRQRIPQNANIISAYLFIKCRSTYAFSGGVLLVGSHGNDSAPPTWGGGNPAYLKPNRSRTPAYGNAWVTDSTGLGVDVAGIVREIITYQASGITVGEAPSNNFGDYAIFYAPASGQAPGINIKWEV